MAEWSNAAVLKTVEQRCSGGSNPSLSAKEQKNKGVQFALLYFLFILRELECIQTPTMEPEVLEGIYVRLEQRGYDLSDIILVEQNDTPTAL